VSGNADPLLLQHVRRLAAAASSDEQLLADFLARRSDEAFAALLGRHGPMVLNVCRRVLHDAHAAEDVFQSTFLVLAGRAGTIRRRASLAGYLHGVAYRLAVRARRRGLRCPPAAVCDRPAAAPEDLAWKEMLGILDEELSRLPDPYRAPLVLCYLEGRTRDEAARHLGWGLNTLRRRLARGKKLLEARLRGRGVTLPATLAGVLAAGAASVPGPLRAATLAAAGARAAGATAGASARGGIAVLLSTSGRRVAALAAVVALGAALCLGYCWATQADQDPAPGEAPPQIAAPAEGAVRDDGKGDPLPVRGVVRLGTARYRHGTRIESLSVSADGRLAVASSGNSPYNAALAGRYSPARIFDMTDGRCLYSLPDEHGPYDDYPEAAGLSPDGKTLATRDDRFLRFWDAATGKELRKFNYTSAGGGGRSPTDWLTFTPDGKQVAVTLMGDAVQLIDVATCKAVRTFSPGAAAIACVFSPDGKLMASGGYRQDNGIYHAHLWEVATGKELRRFALGHKLNHPVSVLAFSHDGTRLAGAAWGEGKLCLFEVASGKEIKVFPRIGNEVSAVAFAPDGSTVAAAGDNIHLYDLTTGKERLRIERKAQSLVFTRNSPLAPAGRGVGGEGLVLTGAVSGAIYQWDAATGRQLLPAPGQDSAVEQIVVSADGRSLFTTDQDGDLYLWDAAGKKPPRRIAGGIERGLVASPDRRLLAWTVQDKHGNSRIRLYDIAADRLLDPALRSSEGFSSIGGAAAVTGFLPGGKSLLTFQAPATFRLWDVESGKEVRSFAAVLPKPGAMAPGAAPAKGFDVPVRLRSVATGKAGPELSQPLNVAAVPDDAGSGSVSYMGFGPLPSCTTRRAALSPDGKMVAISRDWPAAFGNRRTKPMDGRAFSPDGRFLADWAENPLGPSRMDHVHVWDAATGRAVATLAAGPRPGATAAAFSPDGRTLATAPADGVVRLWETATWRVRAEFRGHRDRVTAVAFGPDGRLYTGGLDTVVLGWDVRPPHDPAGGTLAAAWEALADTDARAGFRAQGRFLADPDKAVKWFAARLTPARPPDPARVKELIADLNSDNFAARERATEDLRDHGPAAEAALRDVVAKSPSLEARRRAERLLRELAGPVPPPRELRALRAAEVLEWAATPEARALLRELAGGAPGARLTREAAAACVRLGAKE
jgi:RNA polymerase sigma factor (sigma-70 family)